MAKYLIINADDFGMNSIYNEEILKLLEASKISSVTVMIGRYDPNQKAQYDKLKKLAANKKISVGLHAENGKGSLTEQYENFHSILGFFPSHLDIHKPESAFVDEVFKFAEEHNIPHRNQGDNKGITTDEKRFFGSLLSFNEIEKWVSSLEDGKYYEILFHPGKFDPNSKSTMNKEREADVEKIHLLNSILKKYDIEMVSFLEIIGKNLF